MTSTCLLIALYPHFEHVWSFGVRIASARKDKKNHVGLVIAVIIVYPLQAVEPLGILL